MSKYLRFLTYALLLSAIGLVVRNRVAVIPVHLEPPSYEVQAQTAMAAECLENVLASPFGVSGGLPSGQTWVHREGPDFDVWLSDFRLVDAQVHLGVYLGGHPRVRMPREGLSSGVVGGVPVLWWKRVDAGYQTVWDAIVPRKSDSREDFVHIWIASLHPRRVEEAAAELESVRFTQ